MNDPAAARAPSVAMSDGGAGSNPYAAALDGLALADPVTAFFDFCRAREQVRVRRESGAPPPWSDDPILQRGRFLNVFREDDRGTVAVRRFVSPVADDLDRLVHALFFARWCNRPTTLDRLSPANLTDTDSLYRRLELMAQQPWCNVTAYPVEPVWYQGRLHTRLETATRLFAELAGELTEAIRMARGDVVRATAAVNALLGMANDFPIFMAVVDIAAFRPDVVDPASPVPTGIGAAPFLDRLQHHLGLSDHHRTAAQMIALQPQYWPQAKRRLQPIDVEYLACECRKYFSYVNGTKSFHGKNRFRPGEAAALWFDIPRSAARADTTTEQTGIHVIAGGPGSGKTRLIDALEASGHTVVRETAEQALRAGVDVGRTAAELRADPVAWQLQMLERDYALYDSLPAKERVFADTSFVEDVVFAARAGIRIGPRTDAWLRRRRYRKVFFLAPLPALYEQNAVRLETPELAELIGDAVRAAYERYGYRLIPIPAAPLTERLALVLSHVDG